MTDSFPRRFARTARFTAGTPRGFIPAPDGSRVAFVRSASGTERAGLLWVLDLPGGTERLVADGATLLAGAGEELTAQERSRRERMREGGAGITSFSADEDVTSATFALSSRLFVVDLTGGSVDGDGAGTHELPSAGPVIDPQMSPDGRAVAYVTGGALHVVSTDSSTTTISRVVAEPDSGDVTYGLADFAAAEELDRFRGFWWSPGSDNLLVSRVDTGKVPVWHIADPANPETPPSEHRYPAAGAANADVTLWLVSPDDRRPRIEVVWDHDAYPYVGQVHWSTYGPLLVQVLNRSQDVSLILAVGPDGATDTVRELTDPGWIDIIVGSPAWTASGALVTAEVSDDRYALTIGGHPVSDPGVNVRRILHAGDDVLVRASDPSGSEHVYRWAESDGFSRLTSADGVHTAVANDAITVLATAHATEPMTTYTVLPTIGGARAAANGNGATAGIPVRSVAEDPELRPKPKLFSAGERRIPTAVVLPSGWAAADPPLPVLLSPYGGPHHAEVTRAAAGYLEDQWWADQGFCVIIADGRGTPGTPSWERAVKYDLATAPLEDQVDALLAVAAELPGVLDLDRVAIRGWSFGGYLSALAVLRRPDIFHAAVAGAPVTQWELYDTAYTERYLGLPAEHPQAYVDGSLVAIADQLVRPLMIIHGMADDNVTAAHSLRLSSALLAAGRPHTFLPLSGVTHMTPQEVVAENLLLLQLDFLRNALDRRSSS